MKKLSGKVFVVTGAARLRGIGRATALCLAQDGADVVVSAPARDPAQFPEHEREACWLGYGTRRPLMMSKAHGAGRLQCFVHRENHSRSSRCRAASSERMMFDQRAQPLAARMSGPG